MLYGQLGNVATFTCKENLYLQCSSIAKGAFLWEVSDPRSLGSWCIKGADESYLRVASSVPFDAS